MEKRSEAQTGAQENNTDQDKIFLVELKNHEIQLRKILEDPSESEEYKNDIVKMLNENATQQEILTKKDTKKPQDDSTELAKWFIKEDEMIHEVSITNIGANRKIFGDEDVSAEEISGVPNAEDQKASLIRKNEEEEKEIEESMKRLKEKNKVNATKKKAQEETDKVLMEKNLEAIKERQRTDAEKEEIENIRKAIHSNKEALPFIKKLQGENILKSKEVAGLKAELEAEKKAEVTGKKLVAIEAIIPEKIKELSDKEEKGFWKTVKDNKGKLALGALLLGSSIVATGGGVLIGGALLHLPYGLGYAALGGTSNVITGALGGAAIGASFMKESFRDMFVAAENKKEPVSSESQTVEKQPVTSEAGTKKWLNSKDEIDIDAIIKLVDEKDPNFIDKLGSNSELFDKALKAFSDNESKFPYTGKKRSINRISSWLKDSKKQFEESQSEESVSDSVTRAVKVVAKEAKEFVPTAVEDEPVIAGVIEHEMTPIVEETKETSGNKEKSAYSPEVILSVVNEMEKLIIGFGKGEIKGKELLEHVQVAEGVRKKYGDEKAKPLIDAIQNKTYSFDKKTRRQIVDAMIEYAQEKNMKSSEVLDYVTYFENVNHIGKGKNHRWLMGKEIKKA